jgi:uncharacterized protein YegJ (DUF2314 family)
MKITLRFIHRVMSRRPIQRTPSKQEIQTVKRLYTSILSVALLAGAVAPARAFHTFGREDLQPAAEPQVFNVDRHNDAMKRAVHQARRTVGVFIQALRHPAGGQSDFEVKKPFRQGDVVEHLWLSDVSFRGNRFHGHVDNVPRKIKGPKMGDRVTVNPNEISDWAFINNGRLVGGYTIRVLYAELSPEGRKQLDDEARFRIETHR